MCCLDCGLADDDDDNDDDDGFSTALIGQDCHQQQALTS